MFCLSHIYFSKQSCRAVLPGQLYSIRQNSLFSIKYKDMIWKRLSYVTAKINHFIGSYYSLIINRSGVYLWRDFGKGALPAGSDCRLDVLSVEASGEREISLSGDFSRMKQNSGPTSLRWNRYFRNKAKLWSRLTIPNSLLKKKHKQVPGLSPQSRLCFFSVTPPLPRLIWSGRLHSRLPIPLQSWTWSALPWFVISWLEFTIWKHHDSALVVKVLLTLFFSGLFPKMQCQQQYVQ